MRTRSSFGIAGGVGVLGLAAALLPAPVSASAARSVPATASAAAQTLDVGGKAKISARGAAIRIPYSYLCATGWDGNLNVQVVQAVGENLASGYASKNIECSGAKKTASLYLQVGAYQGARPFRAGPASVVATLDSFDPKADPCSNGGPCPVMAEPKPVPPAMFKAASTADRPTMASADTHAHSEVHGTITLVD